MITVLNLADAAHNRKQREALLTIEFASKLKTGGVVTDIKYQLDSSAFTKAGISVWRL